jgi:hypothetical protein
MVNEGDADAIETPSEMVMLHLTQRLIPTNTDELDEIFLGI